MIGLPLVMLNTPDGELSFMLGGGALVAVLAGIATVDDTEVVLETFELLWPGPS